MGNAPDRHGTVLTYVGVLLGFLAIMVTAGNYILPLLLKQQPIPTDVSTPAITVIVVTATSSVAELPTNSPTSTQPPTAQPNNPTQESVLPTSTYTQTPDVSAQFTSAAPIFFPPSPVSLASGETFSLIDGWGWICTGDISITTPNGNTSSLYDNSQQTGLLLVIAPDSKITVNAQYGGYCEPFSQDNKNSRLAELTTSMLDNGCASGCSQVNVKEIDINGKVTSDNWSS